MFTQVHGISTPHNIPVVSVIIASYNASKTISRAVQTALGQSQFVEVIVVDDASTDDTAMLAAKADDGSGRLTVVRLESNSGPAAARNVGLSLSRAKFITPLDADDYMLPGRVEKLVGGIGDADFLADDLFRQVEGEDQVVPSRMIEPEGSDFSEITLSQFVDRNVSRDTHRRELGYLKPLMRRAFLDKFSLRYEENLRLGEDYALYASALAAGARFVVSEGFGYVAVHRADSLSTQFTRSDMQRLQDFDRRLLERFDLAGEEKRTIKWHALALKLYTTRRFGPGED